MDKQGGFSDSASEFKSERYGRLENAVRACPPDIKAHMTRQSVPQDGCLFLQGFEERNVYILVSGRMKVFTVSPGGRSHHLASMYPVSLCGEFEAFTGRETITACRAETDSVVLALPYSYFLQWLREDWDFNLAVMEGLVNRACGLVLGESSLFGKTVRLRVLELMCYASSNGERVMSKQRLSEESLSSLRSVNRALSWIQQRGAAASQRGVVEILDPEMLHCLCADERREAGRL